MADAVQFNSIMPDSQYAEYETVSVGESNKGTRKRKKKMSKREKKEGSATKILTVMNFDGNVRANTEIQQRKRACISALCYPKLT